MEVRSIAYFSMEIALHDEIPTYAGGLGVLAGDMIRSAADLKVPLVAVSMLSRKGYFYQKLTPDGYQTEGPVVWNINDHLEEMPQRTTVNIEGRQVHVRAWRYEVKGISGYRIPVYLLDTDLPENSDRDQTLTNWLYGGDSSYRLCQEAILGIGGLRMLNELGYDHLNRYHMNEGHASLLTLEMLDEQRATAGRKQLTSDDIDMVRKKCVFTTHTPVPAGHDQFSVDLATRILGRHDFAEHKNIFCCEDSFNLTYLALNLSHYVNGVAKRHGLISKHMFGHYIIDSITNGVHAATWTGPAFAKLFDLHIPGWREDNFSLRYALNIPSAEVWSAHQQQKQLLLDLIRQQAGVDLKPDILTIGFARRMTAYKRPHLIFHNLETLRKIAAQAGGLQLIFAGKAHPNDGGGKELIHSIFQAEEELKDLIRIVFLENYDLQKARLMVGGVDLWLNTPEPPLEASGTSGMKAALNGVPSLSILDGWWLEGCIEGLTGWSIGEDAIDPEHRLDGEKDVHSLYEKLEKTIIPVFYQQREQYLNIMRHAIALNGSFFNTQRMLSQYVLKAYFG
ncbi:Maltodextrin phosphorylase [Gimesia panareensis]|uniref:glycogen phosphorylase n=1 Tax=Gimesia panareensis TaxID=2527978 RepID=A0A518FW83_9PLAN|nr:alpha-glucan family phosphorylase [Gimesia panareensis]QDV20550.1 Maltodextrin phosphorylase [Gimesia panareensis]